ncbi:MAG: translation elongation factor Ts [Pseudomonadota bacterium]
MSNITAAAVSELRKATGAGLMACKKSLTKTNGDMKQAMELLRKEGLAKADKKSSLKAAEGLIGIYSDAANAAVMVEINSQTDFVNKNPEFQSLIENVAKHALNSSGDIEQIKQLTIADAGINIEQYIKEFSGKIGENIVFRRCADLSVENGVISSYVHNAVSGNIGKIAVLIALESNAADKQKLQDFGRKLAMHIVAMNPQSINTDSLDPQLIEDEKRIFTEQAKESGKPDNIIEKMVQGRINKFYSEVVLLEQMFVVDGKTKVSDLIAQFSKEIGADVTIKNYVKFAVGEGLED